MIVGLSIVDLKGKNRMRNNIQSSIINHQLSIINCLFSIVDLLLPIEGKEFIREQYL